MSVAFVKKASKYAFAHRFLSSLLSSLGAHECFQYGAFVVEDPGHLVYKALRQDRRTSKRVGAKTHRLLMATKFRNGVTGDPELARLGQFEYHFSEPIQDVCSSLCTDEGCRNEAAHVDKRIVLFYAFSATDRAGVRRDYTYLNFQEHTYLDPRHAAMAFKVYALRKPEVSRYWRSRRENQTHTTPQEDSPAERFYTDNVRSGNELFLPYSKIEGLVKTAALATHLPSPS
jgi:hypothetical protein